MSAFHDSEEWKELAKRHKAIARSNNNWKCVDCRYNHRLHSSHILPQSKYPESRLWLSNLVLQCPNCNYALGARIKWCARAPILLGAVMLIRIARWGMAAALLLYIIHDGKYNDWMATKSILADLQAVTTKGYELVGDFQQPETGTP